MKRAGKAAAASAAGKAKAEKEKKAEQDRLARKQKLSLRAPMTASTDESGGVSAENLNDIPSQLLQAHTPTAHRVVPCACWALRLP